MTPVELAATVRGIVMEHARLPVPRVDDHHLLTRDLGFDSLAFCLALDDLAHRVRFQFPLDRLEELRDISFGQFLALIATDRARGGVEPS